MDRLTFARVGAVLAAPLGVAAIVGIFRPPHSLAGARGAAPAVEALAAGPQWLNTKPLSPADLRGKVVVVGFWTYSCINSLRALPYLRAWSETYKDRGLVVVGVHSPEFGFEHELANVERATAELDVDFPVLVDSGWRTWRAFRNNAWPSFYIIDADGRVRRHTIGEGGYDESERFIRKLLAEADKRPLPQASTRVSATGAQAPADLADLRSGETYLGYAKAAGFAGGRLTHDDQRFYRPSPKLPLNSWTLSGSWTVGPEFAMSEAPRATVAYRFHARDLHMVLSPTTSERPVRFRIRIDGGPPGADHGADVGPDGSGVLGEPRMYQLVRQTRPVADRTFEIEFLDPGARAFVFTFG